MTVSLGDTDYVSVEVIAAQRIYALKTSAPFNERLGISLFYFSPIVVGSFKVVSADKEIVIDQITLANPTVVRTTAAHGLVNGETVELRGSDSTPTVDGIRVATVTDATHFTIPVNVTVAGTEAEGLADTDEITGALNTGGGSARDRILIGDGSAIVLLGALGKGLWLISRTLNGTGSGTVSIVSLQVDAAV